MDPKVQKNLTEAIEELEEKLKPLQGLDSLSDNLSRLNGDLYATAKVLEQSGKPFPDALEALKRASDLLAETSTLLNNADPKVVAEGLGHLDASLKSLNSDLSQTIEDAVGEIQSISKRVSSLHEQTYRTQEQLEAGLSVISTEIKALSDSTASSVRRVRTFTTVFGIISLILGSVIIGLLMTSA